MSLTQHLESNRELAANRGLPSPRARAGGALRQARGVPVWVLVALLLVLAAPAAFAELAPAALIYPKSDQDWVWDACKVGQRVAMSAGPLVSIYGSQPTTRWYYPDVTLGFATAEISARSFNYAPAIASDGTRFFVADPANYRVLIWNSIPTTNATPADVVVGQSSFTSSYYPMSLSASALQYPQGVATDGRRLFVADSTAKRVLVWDPIPITNNTPAQYVLGAPDFTTRGSAATDSAHFEPYHISCDGTRLLVSDKFRNRILIWNTPPTQNEAAADVVVGQPDFATNTGGTTLDKMKRPGKAFSDGTSLFVADADNYRVLVWNAIPTDNGAEAIGSVMIGDKPSSVHVSGKRAYVAAARKVEVHDVSATGAALVIGLERAYNRSTQDAWSVELKNIGFSAANRTAASLTILPGGVTPTVRNYNCTNVAVPLRIPARGLGAVWFDFPWLANHPPEGEYPATLSVTAMDVDSEESFSVTQELSTTLLVRTGGYIPRPSVTWAQGTTGTCDPYPCKNSIGDAAGMCRVGDKLVVADYQFHRILIWNTFPTSNFTPPNVVLGQTSFSSSGAPNAGGSVPTNKSLKYPNAVRTDGQRLFVADTGNNRVLIWNTVPTLNNTAANLVLGQTDFVSTGTQFNNPKDVCWDGHRLLVADPGHSAIRVWEGLPTANGQAPTWSISQPTPLGVWSDGRKLVVFLGSNSPYYTGAVRIWHETPTFASQNRVYDVGWDYEATCAYGFGPMAFATDGKQLAIVGRCRVQYWRTLPTLNPCSQGIVFPPNPDCQFFATDTYYDCLLDGACDNTITPSGAAMFDGSDLYLGMRRIDYAVQYSSYSKLVRLSKSGCCGWVDPSTGAKLTLTPGTMPANVSKGQLFTHTAVVGNTGTETADITSTSLTFSPAGLWATPDVANPITLAAGVTATFTYAVTVDVTATSGPCTPTLSVLAKDHVGGHDVSAQKVLDTAPNVQAAAALALGPTSAPVCVTQGQVFTCTAVVTNTGETTADVTSTSLTFACAGVTAVPLETNPGSLAGGVSATFTYTVTVDVAATAGPCTPTLTVLAKDRNSGQDASKDRALDAAVNVQTAAALTFGAVTAPGAATQGQQFNLAVVVTNTGGATADITSTALTFSGAGVTAAPLETNPASLAGGVSATFNYAVTVGPAAEPGPYTPTLQVLAKDHNSGVDVSQSKELELAIAIQTPAALSLGKVTAPATAATGQQFNLAVIVTNVGGATADITATSLTFTGTGVTAAPDGSNPGSLTGGVSATFNYTVTVGASTEPGPYTPTLEVLAKDHNSGADVSQSKDLEVAIEVLATAALALGPASSPKVVSQAQTFTVTVVVTNTGGHTADLTSTALTFSPNGLTAVPLETNPTSLAAGASAPFHYTVTAALSAMPGAYTPTQTVLAKDHDTNVDVSKSGELALALAVQAQAALAFGTVTAPQAATQGQQFNLAVVVANPGDATADITSTALTFGGVGVTAVPLGTNPGSLAGGVSATFNYTVTVGVSAVPGPYTPTLSVLAKDHNSGADVSKSKDLDLAIAIQTAAALTFGAVTAPAAATQGQQFNLAVVVTNTGGATADITSTALTFNGSGVTAAPLETNPASLAGGVSATFNYTVTVGPAAEPGPYTPALQVLAKDHNSGADVSQSKALDLVIAIQTPAALSLGEVTAPATAGTGQQFNLAVVVENVGGATADITSTALTFTGTGVTAAPSNSNPGSLAGGVSATFNYTVTVGMAAEPGPYTPTLQVLAKDHNSGADVSQSKELKVAIEVLAAAALALGPATGPSPVSQGQTFTVTVVVTNTGGHTADITSTALTFSPNGLTAVPLETNPTSLAAGISATFRYGVTAGISAVPGAYTPTQTVLAKDHDTNADVSKSGELALGLAVQARAALAFGAVTAPQAATQGQQFNLAVVVTNTGDATADITSTALTFSGAGVTAVPLGTNPGSLAGGVSATFNYAVTVAVSAEPVPYTPTLAVLAKDHTSGADVSQSKELGLAIVIRKLAALTFGAVTAPRTATQGQQFNLAVVVLNTGDNTADLTSTSLTFNGLGVTAVPLGTNPASLAGGVSATFNYTVTVAPDAETGPRIPTLAVLAKDHDTGADVSKTEPLALTLTVQTVAALVHGSVTAPVSVTQGQQFNLAVVVSNTGDATADLTSTSLGFSAPGLTATPLGTNPTSLAGGVSATFDYTVTVAVSAAPGPYTPTQTVLAKDSNSGADVSVTKPLPAVVVRARAALSLGNVTAPEQVSTGQTFTVAVVVTNTGENTADITSTSLIFSGTGMTAVPLGTNPASLPGGISATFTFTVTVAPDASPGERTPTLAVLAKDHDTGVDVSETEPLQFGLTVQRQATLAYGRVTAPASAVQGQQFNLAVVVTNTGDATADLTSTALTFSGAGVTATPSGSNPTSLAGGVSATFDYTVTVAVSAAPGPCTPTQTVLAQDRNSGADVSLAMELDFALDVLTKATLALGPATGPESVSRGRTFTVTAVVTNLGDSAADLTSTALTFSGLGVNAVPLGTNPTSLGAGISATFTYTVTVDPGAASGARTPTLEVLAKDHTTGADVSKSQPLALTITVQPGYISDLVPNPVVNDTPTPVTLTGDGFTGVIGLRLNDPDATVITDVRVLDDGTVIGILPPGVLPGQYDVILIRPTGEQTPGGEKLVVVPGRGLVAAIEPDLAVNDVPTPITLTGVGFTGATAVTLDDPNHTPLTDVRVLEDGSLTATLPPGVTPGAYGLLVTTPRGPGRPSSPRLTVVAPPVASPVGNLTGTLPGFIRLDGSESTGPSRWPLLYHWSVISVPPGSRVTTGSLSDNHSVTASRPSFTPDRKGTYVLSLVVSSGDFDSPPATVIVTIANSAPTVTATPRVDALAGQRAQLTATGQDPDPEDTITLTWRFVSVPAASRLTTAAILPNGTAAAGSAGFTPDAPGTYLLEVVASDGEAVSSPAAVRVAAAQATGALVFLGPLGGDRLTDDDSPSPGLQTTVRLRVAGGPGLPVQLVVNGVVVATGTSGPDGIATFPNVTLPIGQESVVTATQGGNTAGIRVTVPSDLLPHASVRTTGSTTGGPRTLELDASGSFSPTNQPLTYRWRLVTRPPGASPFESTLPTAPYIATVPGTYVFEVTVTDPNGGITKTLTLTVDNVPPVADAGPGRQVVLLRDDYPVPGATLSVTLNGTASDDPNSQPLTYSWRVSRFPGSSPLVTFSSTTDPRPIVTFSNATVGGVPLTPLLAAGPYVFELTVTKGPFVRVSTVQIVAIDPRNLVPAADAGLDRCFELRHNAQGATIPSFPDLTVVPAHDSSGNPLNLRSHVRLDGRESSDSMDRPITYRWSVVSVPQGSNLSSLLAANTPFPYFTPDKEGTYTFQLVVNNTIYDSAPALVTIVLGRANRPPQTVLQAANLQRLLTASPLDPPLQVELGSRIVLDGSGSFDPDPADQGRLTYLWSQTEGASVSLEPGTTVPTISFLATQPGRVAFRLTLADPQQARDTATIACFVRPAQMPTLSLRATATTTADSGVNQPEGISATPVRSLRVTVPTTVTLTGTLAGAAVGQVFDQVWRQVSGPTVMLSSSGRLGTTDLQSATSFSPTTSRIHVFELLVYPLDASGMRTSVFLKRSIRVIVDTTESSVPVAEGELNPQLIPLTGPASDRIVVLDGTRSKLVGVLAQRGLTLYYSWRQLAGPRGVIDNPYAVKTFFTAPEITRDTNTRNYFFELTVDVTPPGDRSEPIYLQMQQRGAASTRMVRVYIDGVPVSAATTLTAEPFAIPVAFPPGLMSGAVMTLEEVDPFADRMQPPTVLRTVRLVFDANGVRERIPAPSDRTIAVGTSVLGGTTTVIFTGLTGGGGAWVGEATGTGGGGGAGGGGGCAFGSPTAPRRLDLLLLLVPFMVLAARAFKRRRT